jgi:hypothetical protein
MSNTDIVKTKAIHHRGTEGTEKSFLLFPRSHAPAW